jgi:hypothetical protein
VVGLPVLLVPQVLQEGDPHVRPIGPGVQGRQDAGEGGLEGVVLPGVVLEGFGGKRPGHPLPVERVAQEMPLVDEPVDAREQIHEVSPFIVGS